MIQSYLIGDRSGAAIRCQYCSDFFILLIVIRTVKAESKTVNILHIVHMGVNY